MMIDEIELQSPAQDYLSMLQQCQEDISLQQSERDAVQKRIAELTAEKASILAHQAEQRSKLADMRKAHQEATTASVLEERFLKLATNTSVVGAVVRDSVSALVHEDNLQLRLQSLEHTQEQEQARDEKDLRRLENLTMKLQASLSNINEHLSLNVALEKKISRQHGASLLAQHQQYLQDIHQRIGTLELELALAREAQNDASLQALEELKPWPLLHVQIRPLCVVDDATTRLVEACLDYRKEFSKIEDMISFVQKYKLDVHFFTVDAFNQLLFSEVTDNLALWLAAYKEMLKK